MTRKEHEVDPTTQGSMLPPAAGAVATGAMVELDGGFYKQPATEPKPLTPEQEALKAESTALFLLDKACVTKRNITNMEKHQRRLKEGRVKEGTDIPTELARLADIDKDGKAVGSIPSSQQRHRSLRRQAKSAFARSIGIETKNVPEVRDVEGTPQEVLIVRAEDPAQQAELTTQYREFEAQYGAANQARQRAARQTQIAESLPPEPA